MSAICTMSKNPSASAILIRRNRGFTLIEIAVVVALAAILTAGLSEMYSQFLQYQRKTERVTKMNVIADALKRAYVNNVATNATSISSDTNYFYFDVTGQAPLPTTQLNQWIGGFALISLPSPNAFAGLLRGGFALENEAASALRSFLPQGTTTDVFNDGGGRFYLAIARTSTVDHRGHTLRVPALYVISAGENGRLETTVTTGFSATQTEIVAAGDDRVRMIEMRDSFIKIVDDSYAQVNRMKGALERFYQSRYLADSSRDPLRNYFSPPPPGQPTALWDISSPLPNAGLGVSVLGNNLALMQALGFGENDMKTPVAMPPSYDWSGATTYSWPSILLSGIRDPSTAATPPYSASISINLPFIIGNMPTATATSTF